MTVVLADAGPPLLWGSAFQLFFGNLFVGVYEAWILIRFFGCDRRRALVAMTAANYLSCAGGVGILYFAPLLPLTGARRFLAVMWLVSAVATYLLELPFCWAALGGVSGRFRRALRANLVVQTASYIPLTFLCIGVSQTGLLWNAHPHDDTRFVRNASWRVYSISPKDRLLHSVRIDGSQSRIETSERLPADAVLVLSSGQNGAWTIGRVTEPELHKWGMSDSREPIASQPVLATSVPYDARVLNPKQWNSWWREFHRIDWRDDGSHPLELVSPPWAWGRVFVGERDLSLETLPRTLRIDRLFLLPDDEAVLEADGEIDVLDLKTLDLGYLANGISPLVLPEDDLVP